MWSWREFFSYACCSSNNDAGVPADSLGRFEDGAADAGAGISAREVNDLLAELKASQKMMESAQLALRKRDEEVDALREALKSALTGDAKAGRMPSEPDPECEPPKVEVPALCRNATSRRSRSDSGNDRPPRRDSPSSPACWLGAGSSAGFQGFQQQPPSPPPSEPEARSSSAGATEKIDSERAVSIEDVLLTAATASAGAPPACKQSSAGSTNAARGSPSSPSPEAEQPMRFRIASEVSEYAGGGSPNRRASAAVSEAVSEVFDIYAMSESGTMHPDLSAASTPSLLRSRQHTPALPRSPREQLRSRAELKDQPPVQLRERPGSPGSGSSRDRYVDEQEQEPEVKAVERSPPKLALPVAIKKKKNKIAMPA